MNPPASTAGDRKRNRKTFEVQRQLISSNVDSTTLIQAAQYMRPCDYMDVVKERASLRRCGYPLCCNMIDTMDYKGKYKLSLSKGRIYNMEDLRTFCGDSCFLYSYFYQQQLSEESVSVRVGTPSIKLLTKSDLERGDKLSLQKDKEAILENHVEELVSNFNEQISISGHTLQVRERVVSMPVFTEEESMSHITLNNPSSVLDPVNIISTSAPEMHFHRNATFHQTSSVSSAPPFSSQKSSSGTINAIGHMQEDDKETAFNEKASMGHASTGSIDIDDRERAALQNMASEALSPKHYKAAMQRSGASQDNSGQMTIMERKNSHHSRFSNPGLS